MPTKFEKLAGKELDGKVWDRYGFTESEWKAMEPMERVVHFNRMNKCEHKATVHDWPWDLVNSYAHDPSFHTLHMDPCKRWAIKPPERWAIACDCQMCLGNFGLTDEDRPRKVNVEAVRLKWQKRFS